jgi:hypothetical protein
MQQCRKKYSGQEQQFKADLDEEMLNKLLEEQAAGGALLRLSCLGATS